MKQDILLIRNILSFTFGQGRLYTYQLITSSVMISLLGLTMPLIILQVFDRVIPNGALETLTWLIAGGMIAVIFESILKFTRVNTTSDISDKFEYDIGKKLFHNILNSSQLQQKSPGKLIDAFNSVSHLRNFYSGELFQSFLDLPFAVIFILIILNISFPIGVFLTIVVVSYFLISKYFLGPLILKMQEAENEIEQKNIAFLVETFSNVLKIKTNHYEEKVLRGCESVQSHISRNTYYKGNVDSVKNLIASIGGQAIFFGVIAIGAYMATTGNLTVGQLTACSFIARRVFGPVQSFSQVIISLEKFNVSNRKIKEILDWDSGELNLDHHDLEIIPANIMGSITMSSLTFEKEGQLKLENLNTHFPAKSFTFIKSEDVYETTVLSELLSGMRSPDTGAVSLDSMNFKNISADDLSNLISYVPQRGTFIEGTVIENITLFNPTKNSLAHDCVAMLGQLNLVSDLPNGFDTKIDSRNVNFYPGLREVMTLARELIKRPRVIIFDRVDEPMDQSDFNSFVWLLGQIKNKMTVIVISKNSYFQKICDRSYDFTSSKLEEGGAA